MTTLADSPTARPRLAPWGLGLAGLAALIATHNPELAARMDRRLRLDGGRLGLRPPDPGPA